MWAVLAIIAGIIGLAAILHRLLHHCPTSSKSHIHKPQSKEEKPNKDDSEPQPRASFRERKGFCHYLTSGKSQTHKPQSQDKNYNKALDNLNTILSELSQESHLLGGEIERRAHASNSNASDALVRRRPVLGNVIEALADPNTHLIGFYGSNDESKTSFLEKVCRRVHRDKLFNLVLTATVTKKPDVKKIQDDFARQLVLTFNNKSKNERAQELIRRIKIEHKILIVLCDLHKGLDLGKVGIPYGPDHAGCKILLTSTTEDVLSNHMHTQKNFMV